MRAALWMCLLASLFIPSVAAAVTPSAGMGVAGFRIPERHAGHGDYDLGPLAMLRLDAFTWRPHHRVSITDSA